MRRGQAEFMDWFPRLMMLLLAVVIIALLVRYFSDREIDASEIHRETYFARLYYDDILMYADERVYPGVIDYDKFTAGRIDSEYGITGRISSKVTLTGCRDAVIYHDKDTYESFIGLARFGTLGPGGATVQEFVVPVTVRDGSDCAATLNVTVVRPNS